MFRRWFSAFWKRNKAKIMTYLKSCILIILGAYMVFAIITMLSKMNESQNRVDETKLVYKPIKTIIAGKNVSSEEYEEEKNLIDVFIDNCNNQKVEEAYDMLHDDCKNELYPNIERFKTLFYDNIFTEKRVYNMQSWVVEDNYHTYLVRFVNDALSTGVYKKDNVYQDYITICEEDNTKKICIGGFIKNENLEKSSESSKITVNVIRKKVYIDYVKYLINVENNSSKTIKLDAYENLSGIKVSMNNGTEHSIDWNGFNMDNLIIKPGSTRKLEIKFNIPYGLNSKPKKMEFTNVVLDYEEYQELGTYEEKTKYENKDKINVSF